MARSSGKDSDVSIIQACRHPRSLALFLFCRTSRDNSAPISRTDWRRSSLYRPAAQLSGDDKGAPTDRARTVGRGRPQLCTQHVQSADPDPRDFRRTTLVVRAFRSRPLRLDRPARTDGGLPRARFYIARGRGDQRSRRLGTGGKLKYKVDVQHGLENAPATLRRLFEGRNEGKQFLRIGE